MKSILQDIYGNHKLAMGVTNEQKKEIILKIYKRSQDLLEQVPLDLIYPPREDRAKYMKEEEIKVLRTINDIEKYSGTYILLDIDNGKIIFSHLNRRKVFEYYNEMEADGELSTTRLLVTRLTAKYIEELTR